MPAAGVNDSFWGDGGKGAVIGIYADSAKASVRFHGGKNSGHSQIFRNQELNYRLVPSGYHLGNLCVMANGVVVDPQALLQEIEGLNRQLQGERTGELYLSDRAHVTMPWHLQIEALEEAESYATTGQMIGTTRMGIGPTYTDKFRRHYAVRVEDLTDEDRLAAKIDRIVRVKEAEISAYKNLVRDLLERRLRNGESTPEDVQKKLAAALDSPPLDRVQILEEHIEYGRRLKEVVSITDTVRLLNDLINRRENVLFEGAQGGCIDIDHGSDYPNCTSSSTLLGSIAAGAGVSPDKVEKRIGVVKAYTSRVGSGTHPTEIKGELGNEIRKRGKEYGRATGRPRRVGWLNGEMLRRGSMLNGYNGIAVVGLNVLAELGDDVQVCTHYDSSGNPVLKRMQSWNKIQEKDVNAGGLKSFPSEALKFLDLVTQIAGTEIVTVVYDFGKHLKLKELF